MTSEIVCADVGVKNKLCGEDEGRYDDDRSFFLVLGEPL